MSEKKQTMRFNDAELSIIKNTFVENEELMKAMRKVFLQMPLTIFDTSILTGAFKGKKELIALMNKTFNPVLDPDAPFHQLIDLWMSVDVKDKSISDLMPIFKGRELLIDILAQQLTALESIANGKDVKFKIKLSDLTNIKGKETEEIYSNIIARNTLINHVETQLTQILLLAGQKEETVEQTKTRLIKNSAK